MGAWLIPLVFLGPGWGLSRRLGSPWPWITAYPLSVALIYLVTLVLVACGQPLAPAPVTLVLALVGLWGLRARGCPREPQEGWHWLLLASAGLGLLLTWRAWCQPLSCTDAYFRWDLLPRLMLEQSSLWFYPPRTAPQLELYPHPDGIPPGVACSYWLLYALAGGPSPQATAWLVFLQVFTCLAAVRQLAFRLFGPGAGALAAAVLASSTLFYRSLAIGQETGLTAVSLCTTLLLVLAGPPRPVLVGLLVGLAGISREYGPAFVVCALAGTRGWSWAQRSRLLAGWGPLVAPWFLFTGQLLLRGNPVFDAMQASWVHGWRQQAGQAAMWGSYARELIREAWLPLLLGLTGVWKAGPAGRVLSLSAALSFLIYLASVPLTTGGGEWAQRVLSPALGALAVGAGAWAGRRGAVGLAALACLMSLPYALTWPTPPSTLPARYWLGAAAHQASPVPPGIAALREFVVRQCPPGTAILSANPCLNPMLRGTGLRAIIAWSPEVYFLYDPAQAPAVLEQRLRALGVRYFLLSDGAEARFMLQFPVFAQGLAHWRQVYEDRWLHLFELP